MAGVMMFMETMRDKVDFMKTRIADMEQKFDRKIDGSHQLLEKTIRQTIEENRALEEHVVKVEQKQENRWV